MLGRRRRDSTDDYACARVLRHCVVHNGGHPDHDVDTCG